MELRNIYIGTSGWSYKHWKETFYPKGTPSKNYLAYYATQFPTTEINNTFYHLPRQSTTENWSQQVPSSFRFSIKMNRYITQMKKLAEPEEPLQRFFTAIEPVKDFVSMILIQLPPSLGFHYERADAFFHFLKMQYSLYTFSLEIRHASWLEVDAISLLIKYDIAFVISQSGNKFPYAEIITSKHIYVRFHGPEALYASPYSDVMLEEYADKFVAWVSEGHTIWAYFNNDINGHAVNNARTLSQLVQQKQK